MAKIVIDPGHGGSDGGASANGIVEKDLNLKISKYMYDRFKELGVPVKLTRDSDIDLSASDRPNKVLSQFGSGSDVIVISNHINAGGGEGAEVIYALRNSDKLARTILDSIAQSGQVVRKYYQKRLPTDTNKDYYYIIRNTPNNQTVIVEYGFLDNVNDANRLKQNYKTYAEAVVKAVSEYIGINYVPLGGSNYYVVKKGDTLWSIARDNGISVNRLKEINGLNSNMISVGQVLYLDNNQINNEDSNNSDEYYIVKKGDSLYSIARIYGMSVEELKLLNNLSSNILSIGQRLKIKTNSDTDNSVFDNVYVVKKGDTLWAIANMFNVNVNDLKLFNNKTSNSLMIGEQLVIPGNVNEDVVDTFNYVIKSGDTLYNLAKRYNTSVSEIKSINKLNSNMLSIGQVLKIPN